MRRVAIFGLVLVAVIGCVSTPESGRKALILTSEGDENAMGLQAYQEILKKEKVANNPRLNGILQRVGQRIAAAANKPSFQWEFKLIESKEKNAFCLPGGKVAFYTGIMSVFDNEAQIAAVMGHEVAHATARHGGQRITTTLGAQAGLAGASILLGGDEGSDKKKLILAALGMGAQVGAILPFSRANETEADEIGLVYMARAGYDPREAAKFWEKFAKESGGAPPTFLSTHPASASRQQNLNARVGMVQGEYDKSPKYGTGEKL